eukprot:IDg1788t1
MSRPSMSAQRSSSSSSRVPVRKILPVRNGSYTYVHAHVCAPPPPRYFPQQAYGCAAAGSGSGTGGSLQMRGGLSRARYHAALGARISIRTIEEYCRGRMNSEHAYEILQ